MDETRDELKKQFEFERGWHDRLLATQNVEERQRLYSDAYGALYRDFFTEASGRTAFGYKPYCEAMLRPFIKGCKIADYGCGLGVSSLDFTRHARQVIGFEVEAAVVERAAARARQAGVPNVDFRVLTLGKMNLPPQSIDVIFSCDVVEHLHPDDFLEHARESLSILQSRGWLIILTPHANYGPHDVSEFFLERGSPPQGLHLREYTFRGIKEVLKKAGFRRIYTAGLSPRVLAGWGLAGLFRWMLRPIDWTIRLEDSFLRRSGFCKGMLELTSIALAARKT